MKVVSGPVKWHVGSAFSGRSGMSIKIPPVSFGTSSQLQNQISQYRTRLTSIKQDIDHNIIDAEKGVGLADAKDLIKKLHHCLKNIQCTLKNMNLT